ncbi:MAG: YicC family protein [Ruminococcus sp.]|nr:YicC family protein [Ruminococcus sp.]
MLRSMTGFGRAEKLLNGRNITVEIRSVNHRYYEFSARVPRSMGFLEEKLKGFLGEYISRGKAEVSVSVVSVDAGDTLIEINKKTAEGYVNALRSVKDELWITDDLSLSSLMRLPDIFTVRKAAVKEEELWEDVKEVCSEAAEKFVKMREAEGEKMRQDVENRLELISGMVTQIERLSPLSAERYRDKLYARLKELLEGKEADEQRIITEAAIFADKTAVAEETVRLKSHIEQLSGMLRQDNAVGRKLDFLIQEFNREANTIGSKAMDIEITRLVVDLKSEIEKIREQIQNIE